MVSMKRRSGMRWDGELKYKTKNCDDCQFKVEFHDKEICSWGTAFRYLVQREKGPRKCEYSGKEPPKNNVAEYVLYAKQNNLFGKSKYYKNYATQSKLERLY